MNRGWLSPERTESVYGVALELSTNGTEYEVNEARTGALRRQRRAGA